eukprot:768637-Hanusia_phi.AAC.10
MQTEQLKIRQQLRKEQMIQRDRKEEYRRKLLMDKLTREQLKQEKDKEIKKLIARETDKLKSKSRMEKEQFNETFGDLETILVREVRCCALRGEPIICQVASDWEDRNESATLLSEDAPVSAEIKSGEYAYFKLRVETRKSWTFAVSSNGLKPLLLIGNKDVAVPSKENFTWSAQNKEKVGHHMINLVVHLRYTLGYWYVAVFAQGGDSKFSLSCSSIEPVDGGAHHDSRRQESISHVRACRKAFTADCMQVHNRVRVKVNELRERRLSQMDPEFISKFEEIFPQN